MIKISKEKLLAVLSEFIDQDLKDEKLKIDSIKNIQIFGSNIDLDIHIENPTLQYRKKIEELFSKLIKNSFEDVQDVKLNFTISAVEKKPEIKGSPIPGVKNIFAISSAKGGVGKSTITANVAVALSNMGYKIGVIDADIYGPSMHIMFDLEHSVPQAVAVKGKRKIKPLESHGVKIVSIGFFATSQQAVVWRGPMASKALNQLLWDTDWRELDYLIVDLPPGTGDIHLSLVQSIPLTGAVVVSTPQNIALADARKGVNMFQLESINVPVLGLVENMAYFTPKELPDNKYFIFGDSGVKGLAEDMKINLLGEIPLVKSVREAADAGRPAVMQSNTPISIIFKELAKNIIFEIEKRNVHLPPTKTVKITNNKGCS